MLNRHQFSKSPREKKRKINSSVRLFPYSMDYWIISIFNKMRYILWYKMQCSALTKVFRWCWIQAEFRNSYSRELSTAVLIFATSLLYIMQGNGCIFSTCIKNIWNPETIQYLKNQLLPSYNVPCHVEDIILGLQGEKHCCVICTVFVIFLQVKHLEITGAELASRCRKSSLEHSLLFLACAQQVSH